MILGISLNAGERLALAGTVTELGSIVASLLGWLLSKLFWRRKERELEKKYAETRKENLELKAQNAGLRVKKQVEDEERRINEDWENSSNDEKYDMLNRDFDDPD